MRNSQAVISLRVKLFADGADQRAIKQLVDNPQISGFTTNPTLMKKAGVVDYRAFARDAVRVVGDRPISFEVFADDLEEMEGQAREIASWGGNVFVKIPVTNTRGEFAGGLIRRLSTAGVRVNATGIMTLEQVERVVDCFAPGVPGFVSVFAGRIADTGRDPVPMMARAVDLLRSGPRIELIWASPRELLNVLQANDVGCHIITATSDLLAKLSLIGKDLTEFSLETVKMFRQDAVAAGFDITVTRKRRAPSRVAQRSHTQPFSL